MPASTNLKRMKSRPQFLAARAGVSERRKTLVVQGVRRPGATPGDWIGEGYTATKKVGNSPVRSRSKRRLREAARALLPAHGVAGCDYVFIARHATATAEWSRLLDDMKSALISLAPPLSVADNAH